VSGQPFVSVVVPTASRPELLEDCLRSLADQDYPGDLFEVIVVIDGADPRCSAAAARAAASGLPVRTIELERGGPAFARNQGLAAATGDPICFLDDDALASPGWLSGLVGGALRHSDAGLLGGPVRPRYEAPPPRTCEEHEIAGATLDCGREDVDVDEAWGCNMALRREAAELVGGFDEELLLAEDWDFGQRLLVAGGRIVHIPDAWIWHRRLASDLKVRTMPREFVRRGWIVGRRRAPVDVRVEARRAWLSLRHALEARCARGLTDAARSLGLLLAALVPRRGAKPPGG
jgi:glycosyltransferase involved in cell wall biosynthesis